MKRCRGSLQDPCVRQPRSASPWACHQLEICACQSETSAPVTGTEVASAAGGFAAESAEAANCGPTADRAVDIMFQRRPVQWAAPGYDSQCSTGDSKRRNDSVGCGSLRLVTPAQRALYTAYAQTGAPTDVGAVQSSTPNRVISAFGIAKCCIEIVARSAPERGLRWNMMSPPGPP